MFSRLRLFPERKKPPEHVKKLKKDGAMSSDLYHSGTLLWPRCLLEFAAEQSFGDT